MAFPFPGTHVGAGIGGVEPRPSSCRRGESPPEVPTTRDALQPTSSSDARILLKHLVRRIRRHWPRTRLTFRGDSHYGRTEAMAWCEENGVDYIFGLAGNAVLHRFSSGRVDSASPTLNRYHDGLRCG